MVILCKNGDSILHTHNLFRIVLHCNKGIPLKKTCRCQSKMTSNAGGNFLQTCEVIQKKGFNTSSSIHDHRSAVTEAQKPHIEERKSRKHQYQIVDRGHVSVAQCNLVHKPVPTPQAMNNPDAKAASDKAWEKLHKLPAWNEANVKSKAAATQEAKNEGKCCISRISWIHATSKIPEVGRAWCAKSKWLYSTKCCNIHSEPQQKVTRWSMYGRMSTQMHPHGTSRITSAKPWVAWSQVSQFGTTSNGVLDARTRTDVNKSNASIMGQIQEGRVAAGEKSLPNAPPHVHCCQPCRQSRSRAVHSR